MAYCVYPLEEKSSEASLIPLLSVFLDKSVLLKYTRKAKEHFVTTTETSMDLNASEKKSDGVRFYHEEERWGKGSP